MSDDLASLRIQLTNAEENLRLIQVRKSEYVQESDIPLQVVRDESHLVQRINELRATLNGHPMSTPSTDEIKETAICSTCGATMRPHAKYCGRCGAENAASPSRQDGDIRFQGSTHVGRDVIHAREYHTSSLPLFNTSVLLILGAALVVFVGLIAWTQLAGTWGQSVQQPPSTQEALPPATMVDSIISPTAMRFNSYVKSENFCVQPGDQVTITASGLIDVGTFAGDGGEVGPEGTERGALGLPIGDTYDLVASFPHASLMYRIDGEPSWRSYADHATRTFTASRMGCLEFQINDNDPGNNSKTDYWDVTVSITPSG